jgi:hypothetical protein
MTSCETVSSVERELKEVKKNQREAETYLDGLSNLFDGAAKEVKFISTDIKKDVKSMERNIKDMEATEQ